MPSKVLITGGAGFIGAHVGAELLAHGYEVRALDSLHGQVHDRREPPAYLGKDVELLVADVREPDAVRRALRGISFVVHLAARVGVAQSMEQIGDYTSVNSLGTAVLLDALRDQPVEKLVVASSMSVYGEGRYLDKAGSPVAACRTREQLDRGEWEPVGPHGERLHAAPTSEDKKPAPASFYALGKLDQERMCLLFGAAYDVPTVALRFFNVHGPHQALSNPYTGVLAIFAARLLSGRPPLLYEDGGQRRDFVSVRDAARACRLALERPQAAERALNIGSGDSMTVRDVAVRLGALLRRDIAPEAPGAYRIGDIRHCFADVSLAADLLGYRPLVTFDEGMAELVAWLQTTAESRPGRADTSSAA